MARRLVARRLHWQAGKRLVTMGLHPIPRGTPPAVWAPPVTSTLQQTELHKALSVPHALIRCAGDHELLHYRQFGP